MTDSSKTEIYDRYREVRYLIQNSLTSKDSSVELEKIRKILETDAGKEALRVSHPWGLVHQAAGARSVECLRLLYEMGADMNMPAKDYYDMTPLHFVTSETNAPFRHKADINAAKFLVEEAGVKLDAKTTQGYTACDIARRYMKNTLADYLQAQMESQGLIKPEVKTEAQVKQEAERAQVSLNDQLWLAAAQRDDDEVVRLIGEGADMKGKTSRGVSVLSSQMMNGDMSSLATLLLHKPALDTPDAYGELAIAKAASVGSRGGISLILLAGGDINAQNDKGCAAIHFDGNNMAAFLLQNGANPTIPDDKGDTAVHMWAMQGGRRQEVKIAHDKGFSIDIPNAKGETPLMLALKEQREDTARALIECGADVTAANKAGMNVLEHAYKYCPSIKGDIELTMAKAKDTRISELEGKVAELQQALSDAASVGSGAAFMQAGRKKSRAPKH